MKWKIIIITLVFSIMFISCFGKNSKPNSEIEKEEIEIPYKNNHNAPLRNFESKVIKLTISIENIEIKRSIGNAVISCLNQKNKFVVLEQEKNIYFYKYDDEDNNKKNSYDYELVIDFVKNETIKLTSEIDSEKFKKSNIKRNYQYGIEQISLSAKLFDSENKIISSSSINYNTFDYMFSNSNSPKIIILYYYDHIYDDENKMWLKKLVNVDISNNFENKFENNYLMSKASSLLIEDVGL